MATLALVLYVVYLLLAFGLRILISFAAPARPASTASAGDRDRPSGSPGSASRWRCWSARPLRYLPCSMWWSRSPPSTPRPPTLPDSSSPSAGLASLSTRRWRWGRAGASASTPRSAPQLVTSGPFALVRNPIFAAMLPTALGLTLLVPSWVAHHRPSWAGSCAGASSPSCRGALSTPGAWPRLRRLRRTSRTLHPRYRPPGLGRRRCAVTRATSPPELTGPAPSLDASTTRKSFKVASEAAGVRTIRFSRPGRSGYGRCTRNRAGPRDPAATARRTLGLPDHANRGSRAQALTST